MMQVEVDLSDLNTTREVLYKFGEVFEFGGPNGNVPVVSPTQGNGWGLNWDALNDSLFYIESGGIWGTSKKVVLPIEIKIMNCKLFERNDSDGFRILQEILDTHVERNRKDGKIMKVSYH